MAIKKACGVAVTVGNTGKECDTSMNATAMLIALHPSVKFTQDDLDDGVNWMIELIHQRKAFPLFGSKAPIRTITNNQESDVTITLDDGLIAFLRYGVYNRIFETTSGGFCYSKALSTFNKSGYSLIEIDQTGQMLARKNSDGTYSGFITDFMYSPAPVWADLKSTLYKNRFQISFQPQEIVTNGVIFDGASEFLSLMGLLDVVLSDAGEQSTTHIFVKALTDCANADVATLFASKLNNTDAWVITDKATGVVVVPTAVSISPTGVIDFTGTFVTGHTYNVKGNSPEAWLTLLVEGYDAETPGGVDILIP